MQAALPIIGMGLQVAGGIMGSQGQAAGYRHAAAQAERKALAARTAADETDASLRGELMTTLGNIRAIRAAAGVLPDSPTGLAIAAGEEKESDRQRLIKVSSLIAQSKQYSDDASFYKSAASTALSTGYLTAFGKGISGLSTMKF